MVAHRQAHPGYRVSAESPGMIVADLFAVAAVMAGVPEDEKIHAIRAYPDLNRVEFIGGRGVYRTSLDAEVEERQPEGDGEDADDNPPDAAPAKARKAS